VRPPTVLTINGTSPWGYHLSSSNVTIQLPEVALISRHAIASGSVVSCGDENGSYRSAADLRNPSDLAPQFQTAEVLLSNEFSGSFQSHFQEFTRRDIYTAEKITIGVMWLISFVNEYFPVSLKKTLLPSIRLNLS